MTTVLYACPYSIYIEIQNNLRREKLHSTNQGSKFLGSSFSNKDNIRPQSNLEEKVNPNIFKDEFSSQTDPSIFTAIAPVTGQIKPVSFFNIEINKPFPTPDHSVL